MRKMGCLFVLALVVGLAPAMADTWAFSFNAPTIVANGVVDITGLQATGGTATLAYDSNSPITMNLVLGSGLSPSGMFLYTSAVSPTSNPQLPAYPPNGGILFATSNDSVELNIWYQSVATPGGGPGYYASVEANGAYFPANDGGWGEQGTFSLTSVPEPGTVSLLVTMLGGVAGLAGILKKKLT